MLEKFYKSEFDNDIVLVDEHSNYTYKDLKSYISGAINIIKDRKQNIVITDDNNFNFIIKFFACVFCKKNIYLITDTKKISKLNIDYDLFEEDKFEKREEHHFEKIDENNIIINFFTSGSTSEPKNIKKTLLNLLQEGTDLGKEFKIQNVSVASSTTMCHLFGMTFHLMFSLCNNLKIYTPSVFYPDNFNKENLVFVSTPTFLNIIEKHKIKFEIAPKYIITAGSKLNENVFKYLEEQTKVIEIYGSSETGVVSHKEHYSAPFKLFDNVQIEVKGETSEITSPYIYKNTTIVNDKLKVEGRNLILGTRSDRLIKIYDKRISAEELEAQLNKNELINECYILKHQDKLVCMSALSKCGQDYLIKKGMYNLKKNLKSYLKSYSEIVPSKWKFTDTIPRTKTGKINKELINHIFGFSLSLPVIFDRREDENSVEYDLYFYSDSNFFNGHFPDFPIVPGVVQIHIAKEFANAHFNLELGQGQWKRIKFTNIIEPNKMITISLIKTEKQVEYKFFDSEKTYSSGVFLCENVFKEFQCI